ncbi:hypothetical protein LUZ63_003826 [Rhynchospora breviuscula]|uniref:KIB1-4 beta-propeller domain-containing protein n=1 Tax=Rhynchospora breviuscula TaxID=2022672 RepID=A0A9Q0D2F8_9POAL|nr:hypothetical protein LUZ63_003826 [Rhynchospora breviuscula]
MEAKEDHLRDWSSLLPEMLNHIDKNLSELSDFVRFRAVCKAWRFSTPIIDQPPQFPWIFVHGYGEPDPDFWCYPITSNKKYTFNAPKIFCMALQTTSDGYIIAQHSLEINENPLSHHFFLFNPLNNHEIRLPAIDFDEHVFPWKYQTGKYVFCYHHDKLSFWYPGQNSWHESNLASWDIHVYVMMLCYKNMIFFLENETGVIKAIDMFTGTLIYDIPPTKDYSTEDVQYMVEALGDILMVIQRSSDSVLSERFDVYRLDANKSGSPCWIKVTSIGDRALFIDCCSALTFRANDFARIKSNSIYFFWDYNNGKCKVKRMDLETGTVECLQDLFMRLPVWFVPNLHHL